MAFNSRHDMLIGMLILVVIGFTIYFGYAKLNEGRECRKDQGAIVKNDRNVNCIAKIPLSR